MVIRRATAEDAVTLAELGERTFIETFGHLYPPQDLRAFLDDSHSQAAYARALTDPACALWIAERDEQPIGYAQAGPCRLPHADVQSDDGELKRLYVLATEQNARVGARLFEAAMQWLERDGPRTLWLSVWSENVGAQRFYARHGFAFAGEYEFPVGAQRDREFIYRRTPAETGGT